MNDEHLSNEAAAAINQRLGGSLVRLGLPSSVQVRKRSHRIFDGSTGWNSVTGFAWLASTRLFVNSSWTFPQPNKYKCVGSARVLRIRSSSFQTLTVALDATPTMETALFALGERLSRIPKELVSRRRNGRRYCCDNRARAWGGAVPTKTAQLLLATALFGLDRDLMSRVPA